MTTGTPELTKNEDLDWDDDKDVWEEQPFDTTTSVERFRIYRDMGPSRSLKQVAQKLDKEGKISGSVEGYMKQLERWCAPHQWVFRCREYDKHMDQMRLDAREEAVKEAKLKLADNLSDILTKAIEVAVERGDRKMLMDLMDRAGVQFDEERNTVDVNLNTSEPLTETIKDTLGASFNDMTQNDD